MRFCEVNESLEYRNCVGESFLDVELLVKYFGGGTLVSEKCAEARKFVVIVCRSRGSENGVGGINRSPASTKAKWF